MDEWYQQLPSQPAQTVSLSSVLVSCCELHVTILYSNYAFNHTISAAFEQPPILS